MVREINHRLEVELLFGVTIDTLKHVVGVADGVAITLHIASVGTQSVLFGERFGISVLVIEVRTLEMQHHEVVVFGIYFVQEAQQRLVKLLYAALLLHPFGSV